MKRFLILKDSFFKIAAVNYIILIAVYFLGENYFLYFSTRIISVSCGAASVDSYHAAAVVLSGLVVSAFSFAIGFYGDFSSEELKKKRGGANVLVGCGMAIVMIVFFCAFMLPCDGAIADSSLSYKAGLGKMILESIRSNYFIFIAFLSVLAGGGGYCLSLAIRLIMVGGDK
jgi:hypothetical protein